MDTIIDPLRRKQIERLEEFVTFGIHPSFGQWVGAIQLSATEAEKCLRLLRRLRKLEGSSK